MLTGKAYGGPTACAHCDSRTWTTRDECHKCGAACCNNCASAIDDTDAPVGYHGVILICERCARVEVDAIACELCGATESDVQEYRAELASAVCCGRPGIIVQSERRVVESQEVA